MQHRSSAGNILLGILAITTFRDFIEMNLEGCTLLQMENPMAALKNYFLHFNTFFYLIYVSLSLILYAFARKCVSLSACFRVGAVAMLLVFLPPIFGYIYEEPSMILYPRDPIGVVLNLHHLADPSYLYEGLTRGMRVEVILAGVGATIFLCVKGRNFFIALFAGICITLSCLVIGLTIPFLTQAYDHGLNFGNHPLYESTLINQGFVIHGAGCKIGLFYILLCMLLFAWAYWLRNPRYFRAVVNNFRWTRSLHYLLVFLGGMTYVYCCPPLGGDFSFIQTMWQHPTDLFGIFMAGVAVFLSFQSAVVFNDIYDRDIDKVTNPSRPLPSHAIPLGEFRFLGRLFAVLALAIALCISEMYFFFIMIYQMLAFLYSTPPFRLRRYLVASNLLLATIFVVTFHAGAVTLVAEYRFWLIPPPITFTLLLSFALALTVKDAKDVEGDKQGHVHTLYTLFGTRVANWVTTVCVCVAALLPAILLHLHELLYYCVAACLLFLLEVVFVKNRRLLEALVVLLYYAYLLVLFYFLSRP